MAAEAARREAELRAEVQRLRGDKQRSEERLDGALERARAEVTEARERRAEEVGRLRAELEGTAALADVRPTPAGPNPGHWRKPEPRHR